MLNAFSKKFRKHKRIMTVLFFNYLITFEKLELFDFIFALSLYPFLAILIYFAIKYTRKGISPQNSSEMGQYILIGCQVRIEQNLYIFPIGYSVHFTMNHSIQ